MAIVVATIAQYIYHHHDNRLAALTTLVLKRLAMVSFYVNSFTQSYSVLTL